MKTFLAICSLFVAAAGFSQSLPSAPHLPLSHRGAFLLTDARVQEEVGLDSEQRSSVAKIMSWLGGKQLAILKSSSPNEEEIKGIDRQASDELLKELSPPQREKLLHVTIRAAGISALVEPEVIKVLKLSTQQEEKIHRVLNAAHRPLEELEAVVGKRMMADRPHAVAIDRSYDAERLRLTKAETIAQRKALEYLTAPQVTQWREMGG